METLEKTLGHVESLRRDLSANIQEETGYWDEVITGGSRGGNWYTGEDVYFVEQKAIPNTEKREVARKELQQLYDSSEWYSARYAAGYALNQYDEKLNDKICLWLDELKRKLELPKYEVKGVRRETTMINECNEDGDEIPYWYTRDEKVKIPENIRIIKNAKEDLRHFYKNNKQKNVRNLAGKALGYSSLRIFANETRIFARENPNNRDFLILCGLALISAGVIAGCKIYEYMAK